MVRLAAVQQPLLIYNMSLKLVLSYIYNALDWIMVDQDIVILHSKDMLSVTEMLCRPWF